MGKLKNIAVVLFMIVFLASLFMNVVHLQVGNRKQEIQQEQPMLIQYHFISPFLKTALLFDMLLNVFLQSRNCRKTYKNCLKAYQNFRKA